jgi:glycosyltransferase involved in cell wall biosynthesis
MIPVYNRVKYLRQAVESVLSQGYGQEEMQIEVVDDCSTHNEAEAIVKEICPERISFYRQPHRTGLVSNWNTCIDRSRGQFVHILHDDDFVAYGYYTEINALKEKHPDQGLYATRSFIVDEASVLTGLTQRLVDLEIPNRFATPLFYENPIRFPGVTVRRTSYETLGGFRADLGFVADWEMWARINDKHGAVVSPKVLAFHRFYTANATWQNFRTAEDGRDTLRLYKIFAERYDGFSLRAAKTKAAELAWSHYNHFKSSGDEPAAYANRQLWLELTPLRQRTVRKFKAAVMPVVRKLVLGSHA